MRLLRYLLLVSAFGVTIAVARDEAPVGLVVALPLILAAYTSMERR
jgi:zinc transporter ZupT